MTLKSYREIQIQSQIAIYQGTIHPTTSTYPSKEILQTHVTINSLTNKKTLSRKSLRIWTPRKKRSCLRRLIRPTTQMIAGMICISTMSMPDWAMEMVSLRSFYRILCQWNLENWVRRSRLILWFRKLKGIKMIQEHEIAKLLRWSGLRIGQRW